MDKTISIYTDGSCLGNPGRGGWASILISDNHYKEISGGYILTTNNRMEIKAVIEALKLIKKDNFKINLYTDSNLIVNTFNKGWIWNWQKNNWKNSKKENVANVDLLQELIPLIKKFNITFNWVKAHNGNEYNEKCDVLAKSAAEIAYEIDENYSNKLN